MKTCTARRGQVNMRSGALRLSTPGMTAAVAHSLGTAIETACLDRVCLLLLQTPGHKTGLTLASAAGCSQGHPLTGAQAAAAPSPLPQQPCALQATQIHVC